VATWAEFANAESDLASFARERMDGRIVYQATLRLDGGPRVHPVSPWLGAGLLCVSFRDTSPKIREAARDARYALHTALPWEDHAGDHGEFMVRGWLEQLSPSHPAVTARPGQPPYRLVHYACSIEEAVATEYSDDELPVYRRWKSSSVPPAGPAEDLGRLGRIEVAARRLLDEMEGRRSATPMLSALAELRAAVNAKP
jgi:hypothetical protein